MQRLAATGRVQFNLALAVAIADSLIAGGLIPPVVIVMPGDAPKVKIEATRGYGAEVRLYDRAQEDRDAIARDLATAMGASLSAGDAPGGGACFTLRLAQFPMRTISE